MAATFTLVLGEGIIHLYCTENNTRVAAGGNGAEWDSYSPQSIQINSGQSMTWFNISPVAELQTVSFVENQSYFPPLAAPLSITNDTQITSIMPDPSIEPTILPKDPAIKDNNKVIILDNSGATSSVVRDSAGKNLMYLPPNSNYSMSGNERYVNTGVMIPKGPSPPGTPELNEFMITFENPGTYNTHVYSIHG